MSAITYPSWWKGGRWDIEQLLSDLFTFEENPAAAGLTNVRVERMFTEIEGQAEHLAAGGGFLLVHRRSGRLNKTSRQWTDETITELAALTTSAGQSIDLMAYITTVLEEFDDGGTVYRSSPHPSGLLTTFMKVPGEVVGPQLIPELIRDERYVPSTWEIHADRPRGLPDYREALGLDSV